jgi:retron-type reverse transcriptase
MGAALHRIAARCVISPLLANLFLHYAFDMWMTRTYPHISFERYADDIICHCKSAEEARALWSALADRFWADCTTNISGRKFPTGTGAWADHRDTTGGG